MTDLSDLSKKEIKLLKWWNIYTGLTPYNLSTRTDWSEEEAEIILNSLEEKNVMRSKMRSTRTWTHDGKSDKNRIGPWYHLTTEGKELEKQAKKEHE